MRDGDVHGAPPQRSRWFWMIIWVSIAKLLLSVYSQQGSYFKDWTALLYLCLATAVIWQIVASEYQREVWTIFVSALFCLFVVHETHMMREHFKW
mmetsp:Transcript_22051/g.67733  ORF Transcript_22051/g.67733 Transcript_22051/m.67733 type:complete len:95 (-) Transcript_22051:237-521(-)